MPKRILPWLVVLSVVLSACSGVFSAGAAGLDKSAAVVLPSETPALLVLRHATASPTPALTQVVNSSKPTALQAAPTRVAPTSTVTPYPQVSVCSPLADYPLEKLSKIVSDPYHPPPMGSDERHQGVDFVYHRMAGMTISILGVQVNSVLPGRVAAALSDTFPYGNLVITETPYAWLPPAWIEKFAIQENQSIYILYAHLLETPAVSLGDAVAGCQAIARVGKSGNTDAPHLHLETRLGPAGATFPSMAGLLAEVSDEERANYKLWRTSGTFLHFDPMRLLAPDLP